MIGPIRAARAWREQILGIACVVSDVRQTVRSYRATQVQNKALASTERSAALREARQGCTHSPACPSATSAARQQAQVVYRDDQFLYLCNGLTLSARDHIPDFLPPALDEANTKIREATRS